MPIPGPIFVADLVVRSNHRYMRTRTYWASDTAPETESHITVMCDAVKSAFQGAYLAIMAKTCYFNRVEGRWYGAGNTFMFANSTSAEAPGGVGSIQQMINDEDISDTEDAMPDQSNLIVQKKTGLVGRANQGRVFVAGIAEQVQFNGEVSDDFQGPCKTFAAKLNTDINVSGSGLTTVLHGRHYNRKDNQFKPITRVYVVKAIGSRRDRRPVRSYERI